MFRKMKQEEIEILRISDINMIHFYNLGNDSEKVPALAIIYDGDKQLNYCAVDEFYKLFVNKICSVYHNTLDKSSIMIDSESAWMLNNIENAFEGEAKKLKIFEGVSYKNDPTYYETSYMDTAVIPLVKHFMQELYRLFDVQLVWNRERTSWHGKGMLSAVCNGADKNYTYDITAFNGHEYSVTVSNFIKINSYLHMRIIFSADLLRVIYDSDEKEIHGMTDYLYDREKNVITSKTSVNANGVEVFIEDTELSAAGGDEAEKIYERLKADGLYDYIVGEDNNSLFVLPGNIGIYIGTSGNRMMTSYISSELRHSVLYCFSRAVAENEVHNIKINVETFYQEIYVRKDAKNIIQTSFDLKNGGLISYNEETVDGKYFYFTGNI